MDKQLVVQTGQRWLVNFWKFLLHLKQRFVDDQVNMRAGHLTYVTLLALVPMIAVTMSMLSAFPVFSDIRQKVEGFIYSNFMPTAGDVVQQYINQFVENASKGGAIGIGALLLVALLLIKDIDHSLNSIWRVKKKRRLMVSFSMYWMVLTLGPVLISTSIAVSSYLLSLKIFTDQHVSSVTTYLLGYVPFLLSILAYIFLYTLVPNKVIRLRHAVTGAVVAASLFELSKKLFAYYLKNFPSYEAIYGTLATIPILFVWVYVTWNIVLIGALITASLEEFENIIQRNKQVTPTTKPLQQLQPTGDEN